MAHAMVTNPILIEATRRIAGLLALATYGFLLLFATLLFLGFAFNPLISNPWTCVAAILARWVPVSIYVWLWRRPARVSLALRGMALAVAILSISLSFFFACVGAEDTFSKILSEFRRSYWECTLDLWPCIVMLLCVTSRAAERIEKQALEIA